MTKPETEKCGCSDQQVCDKCCATTEAVWLMPVATDEPQDSRLLQYAWGRSNLTTSQIAHAYDCIVSAARDCGQTIAAPGSIRAQGGGERCDTCDGTGSVHRADGEYVGECHCTKPDAAPDAGALKVLIDQLELDGHMDKTAHGELLAAIALMRGQSEPVIVAWVNPQHLANLHAIPQMDRTIMTTPLSASKAANRTVPLYIFPSPPKDTADEQ